MQTVCSGGGESSPGARTIHLHGVYVADTRPFCDSTFRPTPCQTRAAVALARTQGFVRCMPQVTYSDRSIGAYCSVAGTGTWIAEAQQKHAEKCEITLDLLTEMTLEAYRTAMADGSAKGADAAVKAVAQLSRMHGLDVGKRPNERSPIEDLTVDERDAVRRMVEQALERARADNSLRKAS